jgi:MoaA/NifB/PqqE/SkfB family radical SAM enzyme
MATSASGILRVCCNSTPGQNFITKEDGSRYRINKDDLKEAWNSETYKTIRQQMLNGERPEMCARCFREEDAGITSTRQNWNEKWAQDRDYTVNAPFNIRYVDIRLGNLCNLKCRMCNPYASNMWVKEWSLVADALEESEYNRLKNMNWPEQAKVWDNLELVADTVEEIYLTGGEPTIIKEQHKLLDYYINKGTAHKIRLKYNTNLTNIPEELVKKWKHFKKIQLNCSIDAYGELDRYIRYPSDWATIDKNFKRIRKQKKVNIEIHCTVQMYNILRLHEFLEYALVLNHKIYFNILNHPECLNIRVLPAKLKDAAFESLMPYLEVPKLKGVIDYMYAEDWSDKMDEFIDYTFALDKSRNQYLTAIIPEFEEYFV